MNYKSKQSLLSHKVRRTASLFAAFLVSAAVVFSGDALTAPPATAAGKTEVEIDLKRYCSSRNLHFAGFSKKRNSFICGEQHVGFNTYYLKNFSKINLTSVCRTLADTNKWRYHGNRAWCIVELASFRMCNQRNEPVWTSMAWFSREKGRRGAKRGWVAQGWWKVNAGQCRTLWTDTRYKGSIYVHGRTGGKTLTGSAASFCVNNKRAFKLDNADKAKCGGGDMKRLGMSKFALKSGMNTWNFR